MTEYKKEAPRLGIYEKVCTEQALAVALERLKPLLEDDSKIRSSCADNVKLAILHAWDLVPDESQTGKTAATAKDEKSKAEELIEEICELSHLETAYDSYKLERIRTLTKEYKGTK